MMMERVYHAWIGEPLRWVALAVFDPARFRAAYEPTSLKARGLMLARLIVPLFLFSWLLVALVRVVPLPAHVLVWSDEAHGLRLSQWEVAAIGVTFGLVVGLLFGVIRGPRGAQRDRLWSSKRLLEPKRSGRVYTFV